MNELVKNEPQPLQSAQPVTAQAVSPIVQMLSSGTFDKDLIKQMMDANDRWEASQAKKEFDIALAKFRTIAPVLSRDSTVDFSSAKGRTHYTFTSLGYTMAKVNPLLGECGLNISWRPNQEGSQIVVKCVLSHSGGHSESVQLSAPADQSGNKNPIQAVKSTISYLERITALSILGLASGEDDDDGVASQPAPEPVIQTIDESDMADIVAVLTEHGKNPELWKAYWVEKKGAGIGGIPLIGKPDKAAAIEQIRRAVEVEPADQESSQ